MTPTTGRAPALTSHFADEFPELSVPWAGAEVTKPTLLALDEALAQEVGLDPSYPASDAGLALLTGTRVPEGTHPVAQAYAGHQFGGYSPRLGDGRALLLGELDDGRDVHLKGSGRTPFSRGGDGLAATGPMLREFLLCSAMHALGIPTTRALAVVGTGQTVRRERPLPGAVLTRVAASHLRVGTFQYARSTGDESLLRRLADHAVRRHHPAAAQDPNPYLALFRAVLDAQAALVARWMAVGFVHGVMNTDNTTISGETIDYGPCAFLKHHDPGAVYSSIDTGGRYAYGAQPTVLQWNLARFAETLVPLVDPEPPTAVEQLTPVLESFPERYASHLTAVVGAKLGLGTGGGDRVGALVTELFELLAAAAPDHTTVFRAFGDAARGHDSDVRELLGGTAAASDWLGRWRALGPDGAEADRANPLYIPRNLLMEEALEAATGGDLGPFTELLAVVTAPFTPRPGLERYTRPAPDGAPPYVTFCGT